MTKALTPHNLAQKSLPKNGNLFDASALKECYSSVKYRNFSIKYVVEGLELYTVNGKKYSVKSGQYLLANRFSEGNVLIDSKHDVRGICIDVSTDFLAEVVSSHLRPDVFQTELELGSFFNTESFLQNKYDARQTKLGTFLNGMEKSLFELSEIKKEPANDFYYTVCEKIIEDHVPIFKQLQNVKAINTETRKDIMRRLLIGKGIIDDCFLDALTVSDIASQSGISEYHFYRLFKKTFGQSPNQYLIQKRLSHAKKLLSTQSISITELASFCGYSDIFTFSKSFKKQFGFSPSAAQR